jgi:site-specific recombinase XerC
MTDEAMSPLRRRMIEDMTIRTLSPKTQQGYIRTIKNSAAFLCRSPDKASFEDVRRFQLHVAQSGVGTGALNATVAALRFFFRVTLKRSAIRLVNKSPPVLPIRSNPPTFSIASAKCVQRTSHAHRQRRNPHST